MVDMNHIIEPERLGLWTAVTFVIALLALVLALVAINRVSDVMYMSQAEALLLNKKIEGVKQAGNAPSAPAEPSQQEQK